MSSVGGTHSGSSASITGATDEAGIVYCIVETTGAVVAASTVKSTGQSTNVGSAGSFAVSVAAADVTGKSAFCVGEDGVGNLGSTASGPFGTPPSDISLSAATVAENAAQGTGEYRIDSKLVSYDTYASRLQDLGVLASAHTGFLVFQGYVSELRPQLADEQCICSTFRLTSPTRAPVARTRRTRASTRKVRIVKWSLIRC